MLRLGDILVAEGVIPRSELEHFAGLTTGLLGEALRAHGKASGRSIARALARQQQLAYVSFDEACPERVLFQPHALPEYIRHRYVPYRLRGHTLTIATTHPTEKLRARVHADTGFQIEMVMVSDRDFTAYLAQAGSVALTRRAQLTVRRKHPTLVANQVLMRHQAVGFMLFSVLLLGMALLAPSTTWKSLLLVCNLFYLATLAFKFILYREGMRAQLPQRELARALKADIGQMQDAELPIYTILIPLYREPRAVAERLIAKLNALEYPKEKLDIKLICEADDHLTIDALKSLRPPETMEIIRVPPSTPRTKPKACNVALQQVRGEYLVIFDAEDAPEPKQLKRALAYFKRVDDRVACLQSPLNYYNRNENLLTQLFALEYSSLFRLLLPALERLKLPIPLGGTSNHIKVATLEAIGGWDAFNVTEDADLGMRLAYLGYETRVLPSLTLEEAPATLDGWMKQRTRWIKGYIQTWLVYMRDPSELKRRLGTRAYYGFQFFIGAPALTFLFAPFFWGMFFLSIFGLIPAKLSAPMIGLCLLSFMGGMISHWMFARSAARIEGWRDMGPTLLVFPFYWLLHSVASFRAVAQLVTAPHYWEKTSHGISGAFK